MDVKAEYTKTRKRVIMRRGVIWLGQTCNLRCKFCYFVDRIKAKNHPEHPFMSIEKARKICDTLVEFYCNSSIDIQGGEPTIYPAIEELARHCSAIGLFPTLITNAIVLANKDFCRKLKSAGVRDYLVSVHGIGKRYDELVGFEGAHDRQIKALDNMSELCIPFRFNTVLSMTALPDLKRITEIAIERRARVLNFISYNPFEDQKKEGKRSSENVPRHSEVASSLTEAMDMLEKADIECNVRYFPLCLVEERHRKSLYNFQQLPYDLHEWDYASWAWTGMQSQRIKKGDTSPPVSLEESLNNAVPIQGPMKCLSTVAKAVISRFPELRAPMVSVRDKMGRLLHRTRPEPQSSPGAEALYRDYARKVSSELYTYGNACRSCGAQAICDGFHNSYAAIYGTDEARPILTTQKIEDPTFFIRNQDKVVESEEYGWAL